MIAVVVVVVVEVAVAMFLWKVKQVVSRWWTSEEIHPELVF